MALADPYLLGAVLILLVPYLCTRRRGLRHSHHALLGRQGRRHLLTWLPDGMLVAAALLLGIALACPQLVGEAQRTRLQGRDIILTVDLSSSMTQTMPGLDGSRASRLQTARAAALEFLDQLQGNRVGLVVFGAKAFGVWPLSADLTVVKRKIAATQGPMPSEFDGTDIEEALWRSLGHFDELGQTQEKILVLLTDGMDTIPPEQQRDLVATMRRLGVTFYLLGIGISAQSDVVQLAHAADGHFFDVTQPGQLTAALRDIAASERSSRVVEAEITRREIFPVFAVASLLCFLLALGLQKLWLVNPV
jgi:Mg-chelatase subunit ChlD